ncbi:MAG: M23 family metallopeptidase [Bacteroidetes bacterium]|nr:M23 family metallopeptidase [Bacteroidota bacterium]
MPVPRERKRRKKKWVQKLHDKYRLVIMNEETYEEKVSFRLSRLNVFVALGAGATLLIFLTTYIIAFTPLREYIPGYMDVDLQKKVYELQLRADSIEREFKLKDIYIVNLKNIISGADVGSDLSLPQDTQANYQNVTLGHSMEDSILRAEFESQDMYDLRFYNESMNSARSSISGFLFFTPLEGIITNTFSPRENHYGIDIVADRNEAVKSTLEGMVIFSGWTLETGYVIMVQHVQNIISVYKHNSVLLKKVGDFVKAGEPIAIIGESGELSTGPHLHFELWYNGLPINPQDYILF